MVFFFHEGMFPSLTRVDPLTVEYVMDLTTPGAYTPPSEPPMECDYPPLDFTNTVDTLNTGYSSYPLNSPQAGTDFQMYVIGADISTFTTGQKFSKETLKAVQTENGMYYYHILPDGSEQLYVYQDGDRIQLGECKGTVPCTDIGTDLAPDDSYFSRLSDAEIQAAWDSVAPGATWIFPPWGEGFPQRIAYTNEPPLSNRAYVEVTI